MISMIKETINDFFFSPYSSFVEKCIGAFVVLILLIIVGLLGLLSFIAIDSVGITPMKTVVTVVEEKRIIPSHTTTGLIPVGKVMVPTIQHHPKSHRLRFKIDGKEFDYTVEKDFFDGLNAGDKIEVDYGFGRLTGQYWPARIRLVR